MNNDFQKLIDTAKKAAGKKELTKDASKGKVACALLTQKGKVFIGQNLSTSADLGYCAEISAISQMLAKEETQIRALVGVTEDGQLIPPCGRCRELMYQLNRNNLKTKILITNNQTLELSELLPHRWQEYWDGRE